MAARSVESVLRERGPLTLRELEAVMPERKRIAVALVAAIGMGFVRRTLGESGVTYEYVPPEERKRK